MFVVLGWFRTWPKIVKTSLAQITFGCSQIAFWKLSFIMLTVQALIWQCHHFSASGKILEANRSSYNCRQILVHANPYRSYMSQAMSSKEFQGTPITSFHILLAGQKQHSVVSAAKLGTLNKDSFNQPLHSDINSKTEWSDHSIPGKSLWSFCDSSVTLFKVKWPPTRRFKRHLASPGISQSYLCLLPGLTSCRVCSSESEPRKPKSGRPRILGNNSSLCHFSVPALATSAGWLVMLDGLFRSFTQKLGREISR